MGNITIQGDLTGDVPGGEVGGASNLTTVGAIPYVSASGVLNQDPTALFWDAANNRLGVGTNAPGTPLQVVGQITSGSFTANSPGSLVLTNTINATATRIDSTSDAGRVRLFNSSNATTWLLNADGAASHYSGGNFLIGTTTDSNFKLDVAASGSAGTARFYGGSGVSNSTKVVVQAGGGQSTTNLTEWQNANGVVTAYATSAGEFGQRQSSVDKWYLNYPSFYFANAGIFAWSSTVDAFGARDLSLSRASAGILQVGDGGSNANGVVSLTRSQHAGVLVAALPAAAAGNAGSIQYVTDANATTIGSTVAGGGANKVMVWSDGAVWKIFAS